MDKYGIKVGSHSIVTFENPLIDYSPFKIRSSMYTMPDEEMKDSQEALPKIWKLKMKKEFLNNSKSLLK